MKTQGSQVRPDRNTGRFGAALLTAFGMLMALPVGSHGAEEGEEESAAAEETGEMGDWEIANAVEDEFIFDSAVPFNDLDVTVTDGIVTLSGDVKNILAKERATTLAETVKGVRAVVNQVEVEPVEDLKPNKLVANVKAALLDDPAAESYEVTVDAEKGGHVILNGAVDSWQEKRLCAQVVKGVRGVTSVQNDISISYETDRADFEIKSEIERRLDWNALVDDALVEVSVEDGVITLSGQVGSAAEKRLATNDAYVSGVSSVNAEPLEVNSLLTDEEKRKDKYVMKSDETVEEAVQDALLYDPRVMSFDITSEVSGGVVTLRGEVDNLKAKQSAEQTARNTVGVLGVSNRIKVRPEGEDLLAGNELAEKIERTFSLDPWVESYEIDVEVDYGTAKLYGNVDNYFEKAHAESIAAGIMGVREVKNQLEVVNVEDEIVYDPYTWQSEAYPWYYYPYYPAGGGEEAGKTDEQILEDVKSELFWSPFVDKDDIDVTVEDGVVAFHGVVDSVKEKESATGNAFEGGARAVDNDLIVAGEE